MLVRPDAFDDYDAALLAVLGQDMHEDLAAFVTEREGVAFVHAEGGTPASGAAIAKGRYKLYPESGLAPGKYKVEIRWAKSTGEKVKEPVYGHSPYVFAEAIPDKYNAESMLKAELSEGSNELHFRLEK